MRYLILLIASTLLASDYVEITFKDGRKLSGVYDSEKETLTLKLGSLTVKAGDIETITKKEKEDEVAAPPRRERTPEEIAQAKAEEENAKTAATENRKAKLVAAKVALVEAQKNPDLRAVINGASARLNARSLGSAACRKMYKDASSDLAKEWADRFELRELNMQKERVAKAERALAKAQREVDRLTKD